MSTMTDTGKKLGAAACAASGKFNSQFSIKKTTFYDKSSFF